MSINATSRGVPHLIDQERGRRNQNDSVMTNEVYAGVDTDNQQLGAGQSTIEQTKEMFDTSTV